MWWQQPTTRRGDMGSVHVSDGACVSYKLPVLSFDEKNIISHTPRWRRVGGEGGDEERRAIHRYLPPFLPFYDDYRDLTTAPPLPPPLLNAPYRGDLHVMIR